ncbi:hypothetical protein Pyn_16272 [Prunus yedoensis var. nudiflora]|uniref:Uncharacterized protein n=2 Tax=Prunus TaxID=3754 RepID=A0A314YL68_PRUYE|nr:uncharacterized protein LOC110767988 [Prunus avium]PQQ06089.1 hypothetical protein Pyn_16272 [Prunus yedoensis var. nudiflora]
MANKTAILICVLVVVVGCSSMQGSEAISACAKPCMPVCMKEEGASIPICEIACENYCKQISGNRNSEWNRYRNL